MPNISFCLYLNKEEHKRWISIIKRKRGKDSEYKAVLDKIKQAVKDAVK